MREERCVVDYGNWVPGKFIAIPAVLAGVLAGFTLWWKPLLAGSLICLAAVVYLLYARRQFSSGGANLQARMRNLLLTHLAWNGKGQVLDIGCGNGAVAIDAARRYPEARVTGIDSWGGKWEYSIESCRRNARLASVDGRTVFRKASAARLPFPDETFDAVVSNMVFHEVRDARGKITVIQEALRVLKKGGVFALQDVFLRKSLYGDPQALVATVRGWGISEARLIDTNQELLMPRAMRLPFMVGSTGLLYGRK